MAQPNYIQKTLRMKPEVSKIFDDLEKWLDHCRFNLLKYDEKDLYKSLDYKAWARYQDPNFRKPRKEFKPRRGQE